MIKVIFFDFDGTISDTRAFIFEGFIRVLEKIHIFRNDNLILKYIGLRFDQIMIKFGGNAKNNNILRKIFFNYLIRLVRKKGIKLCVSITPLKKLKKHYKLIVVLNSEDFFLKYRIKKLEIENLFDEVYAANYVYEKDKIIQDIIKKYHISAYESVYIGDRFSDVRYAKKVGCYSIAIHNVCSWSSLSLVKNEKPDYIISNFEELEKILKRLK